MASISRRRAFPTTATLRTEAWLLRGISSIPGELFLEDGVVGFVAEGPGSAWPWQLRKLEHELHNPGVAHSIDRGDGCALFRWPADVVQAWIPFHYFGGGIRLKRGDVVLSFSFGRPANMDLRVGTDPEDAVDALRQQLGTVRLMRDRGRRWLGALALESRVG